MHTPENFISLRVEGHPHWRTLIWWSKTVRDLVSVFGRVFFLCTLHLCARLLKSESFDHSPRDAVWTAASVRMHTSHAYPLDLPGL